ncbi:MAG: hypothetical protein ACSLFK_08630 [Gemmatimonadaceae bacterium]
MISIRRFAVAALLGTGLTMQACDGGPTAPKTGSLTVNIGNLPSEISAPVTVQGAVGTPPITVNSTRTIADLEPGTYTVMAAKAVGAKASYVPAVLSQVVEVVASSTPATVNVAFALATGIANVAIVGLPPGVDASVTIYNGTGFFVNLKSSTEVGNLDPGEYTLQTDPASGDEVYAGSPIQSKFIITASATPVQLEANYVATTGSIDLSSSGLPTGATPVWDVSGPSNFTVVIRGAQRLARLAPGAYTVSARTFDVGSETYGAAAQSQSLTVTAGTRVPAAFTYVTRPPTLNLSIAGAYITQSSQRFDGSVPLVAGRSAFLRVFVTANELNSAAPRVRARFYRNSELVTTGMMNPVGESVVTTVNEGSSSASWGMMLPAALLTGGLSYVVDVDPENTVREIDETDNRYPASGTPATLDVRSVPPLEIRFVPIETTANSLVGNVTDARVPDLLAATLRMFPVSAYTANVRSTFTTAAAVPATSSEATWVQILGEVNTLRLAEGTAAHYVGILKVPYTSGIAGIGYVPGKTVLSWDASSAAATVAHELGHNWNRRHAPCGGPSGVDLGYPYPNARIGVFGFDVASGVVIDSERRDVMSYCGPEWVSDYTYEAVMNYRGSSPAASVSGSVQSALMVWGSVENGKLALEPAFMTDTRPSLPSRNGRYRVEGLDVSGAQVFSLSFDPQIVGDAAGDVRQFGFAVPMTQQTAARIVTLRLSGEGREVRIVAAGTRGEPAISATVESPDRVRLRWNAADFPMLVVRDPDTREIMAFARGGATTVRTTKRNLDITASNRVGSTRLTVPARN